MRRSIMGACVVTALAVAASSARAQVRVPGFRPSENGFSFANHFPQVPYALISVPGVGAVPIGNASDGLCGGMVFAAIDYWSSGMHAPITANLPALGTPLWSYFWGRLFDSFTPNTLAEAFYLQSTPFGGDRGSEMLGQWPLIKADLDAGRLSPMMLVRIHDDYSVFDLGQNHQVLAWGYDLSGTTARIDIYDPDHADDDTIVIVLDLSTASAYQSGGQAVASFFRTEYAAKTPLTTTSWANGFEGGDAGVWSLTGHGGVDHGVGVARTGANDGWLQATSGANALDTWAPMTAGMTCDVRGWVVTSNGVISGSLAVKRASDGSPLTTVPITGGSNDGRFYAYLGEFVADSNWGLLTVGLMGSSANPWLRVDDVEVVCQSW